MFLNTLLSIEPIVIWTFVAILASCIIISFFLGSFLKKYWLSTKEKTLIKKIHKHKHNILHLSENLLNEAKKNIELEKNKLKQNIDQFAEQQQQMEKTIQHQNRELKQQINIQKHEARLEYNERKEELLGLEKIIKAFELNVESREAKVEKSLLATEQSKKDWNDKVFKLANLTPQEAKQKVFEQVEQDFMEDLNKLTKNKRIALKLKLKDVAVELITLAVNKYAASVINEVTTSIVKLPDDEIKGKIIGKEGRNIKCFELITGTNLMIDEAAKQVKISSFNSLRRAIAVKTLEALIQDGRIQPVKIEECWNKVNAEVEEMILETGKQTVEELQLFNLHEDLIKHIGQLKYRTSYGQNVLNHSIEVANVAGSMAAELSLDRLLATRCGLLHDIGKAVTDLQNPGSHVESGVFLAKKYAESEIVINAIEAHHGDVEPTSPYAILVMAADTISAARAGARKDSVENFIKRMVKIEAICNSIDGVKNSYSLQAGREIMIMIDPDKISEYQMHNVLKEVKNRILSDHEINIPGNVNIAVIRNMKIEGALRDNNHDQVE